MKPDTRLALVFLISAQLFLPFIHVTALNEGDAIAKELICSCGCGKLVYDCYCDTAKDWRARIDEMLENGMTRKEIINSFVNDYGEQVLATPTKSGLELVLWISPVFSAVLGTVVIYRYARNKAPIPDVEVGFPIRDVEPSEQPVTQKEEIQQGDYDGLFEAEYQKFRENQKKKKS